LAKDLGYETRSATFCGTLAYIAPEMLSTKRHGKALDWYMLGLLLFEMLTGQIPFISKDRTQFFQNV
jgi:serine/threonine protein kinase